MRSPRPIIVDFAAVLTLLTRLPVSSSLHVVDIGRALRLAPLAGAVVGGVAAATIVIAHRVGLPAPAAATLAVVGTILTTGGLHEDGLADVADGFGGGSDRERKLAIMRDSRIGTYGTLALICGLAIRIACVAPLIEAGERRAVAGVILAASMSRALMLVPMTLLPQARRDGLAHAVGTVGAPALLTALAIAAAIAVATVGSHALDPARVGVAATFGGGASLGMAALARRHIGGVTGDVAGATQQVAEIAILLVLCAGATAR